MNRTKPTRRNRRSTRREDSIRQRLPRKRGRRMLFEALEDRRLLATEITALSSLGLARQRPHADRDRRAGGRAIRAGGQQR